MFEKLYEKLQEILTEIIISFGISVSWAVITPEIIHFISVCASTFAGTVIIHFTKKYLNKK